MSLELISWKLKTRGWSGEGGEIWEALQEKQQRENHEGVHQSGLSGDPRLGHPLGLKCWGQARDEGRGHGTWVCCAGCKKSVKGFKVNNKTVPLSPKYNEGFTCWKEPSFKVACLVILLFTREKKKILEQSLGRGSVGLETEYFLISQPSADVCIALREQYAYHHPKLTSLPTGSKERAAILFK